MQTSFYSIIHLKQLQSMNSFEAHNFTSDDSTSSCTLSKYEMIKYQAIELLRLQ
jgi:hypothetical protein